MDKNTLSNYGWIVIAVLVLSVMIALATPFGQYVEQGVRATTEGLFNTSRNAVNSAFEDLGVQIDDQTFEEGYTGVNGTPASELPVKGKTLEEYTWAEARDVIVAGKAEEYGFSVGATKSLTYNNNNYTARIIGLDQDGINTATFMFTSSVGNYVMNSCSINTGGFAASDMNSWLNSTAYGLLDDDVKSAITSVIKTNNLGIENPTGTSSSSCKLFLLSVKEVGLKEELNDWSGYEYEHIDSIDAESTLTYTYFQTSGQSRRQEISNNTNYNWWWLRSAYSYYDNYFFCVYNFGELGSDGVNDDIDVVPAFVIG